MKAWAKDQRNQLNVELRGQHISSENVRTSADDDVIVPSPKGSVCSSSHDDNVKNESEVNTYSQYRNMRLNQRPKTCKPRSIPDKRRFKHQRFSSSKESLFGSEMFSGSKVSSKEEKTTTVAWAEKNNQTNGASSEMNDFLPNNQFQQRGTLRIFQKRNQKEKVLLDNGVSEGVEETQPPFQTTSFPVRRMTMTLQHQTSAKDKKQTFIPTSPSKGEHPPERHQCIIPTTLTEPTVYDSIDTERLLRLNFFDSSLVTDLQEELISKHRGDSMKYLSTVAPPSSPRVQSPTPSIDTSHLSAQPVSHNLDTSATITGHSEINTNDLHITVKQAASPTKNISIVNQYDLSTFQSSPSFSHTQNTAEQREKVIENDTKENKCSLNSCIPLAEKAILDKGPTTDVRVRSVQLLCTHSGRLRHTATLIETGPVTFPTKYPSSDKEGIKNITRTTNKVFVSQKNYKPIRMVYEEKEQNKPQDMGIPVTAPHLHRYLSNLQKKQMKLMGERGTSTQGSASSMTLEDGIYKTIKTYQFNPQGLQETVQKTLICKHSPSDNRPKTSSSISTENKTLWKLRPQSGPSRISNYNTSRKFSGTKVLGADKQNKIKKCSDPKGNEPQKPKILNKQQNLCNDDEKENNDDIQVSMETQSNQIIPRVHFERKQNNVSLHSILKKGTQETNSNLLLDSPDFDPKEKLLTLNTDKTDPKEKVTFLNTDKNESICESSENNPEKFEGQSNNNKRVSYSDAHHFTDPEQLHNLKFGSNSQIGSNGSDYNKETKTQSGVLFHGIGVSSDSFSKKDASLWQLQKPLGREIAVVPASTNQNVLNKKNKKENKKVYFHQSNNDSVLPTSSLNRTDCCSDKELGFTKEKSKNTSSHNLHQEEVKNQATNEITVKEIDNYHLSMTKCIQTDKKITSPDKMATLQNYCSNRRLPQDFRIPDSTATELSNQPTTLNLSTSNTKSDARSHSAKSKSERKNGFLKKAKSGKGSKQSKSKKLTGPPVYLTTVPAQNPTDDDDFECEKLSDKLMENGVYISWKTIRGGLYPPSGRSLHYEIADTGLLPSSDLLSHPKNWFPKEYKELQKATKNLERAELVLWKQKRAEDKKFGTKRKKKQTKKKKK